MIQNISVDEDSLLEDLITLNLSFLGKDSVSLAQMLLCLGVSCWCGSFECWLLGFGDCGTNLLFVGECVRVVMLVLVMEWSGLVVLGVWLHCGSLEQRFC